MREDLTRELLRRADALQSEGDAASTEQILRGVQTRVRRRAARRVAGGALATVLLVAALSVGGRWTATPHGGSNGHPGATPQRSDPAVAWVAPARPAAVPDFAGEAELRAALVQRMLVREKDRRRIDELEAELAVPLPDARVAARMQVEQAAATLFQTGERFRDQRLTVVACRQYRQVIDFYPATPWARLAKSRLADCPGS